MRVQQSTDDDLARTRPSGRPAPHSDAAARPRGGLRAVAAPLAEVREQSRSRDAYFRRLLAAADVLAAGSALILVTTVVGDSSSGLQLGALAALPLIVLLSKMLGLYERDELVLNKSTLDEAPAVLQLSTLFVLFVWLAEAYVVDGSLSKTQFAVMWATTVVGVLGARALVRVLGAETAPPERCLVLGPDYAAARIDSKLELGHHSGASIVAREDLEDEHGHVLVSGKLAELVSRTGAERLILVPTATESDAVLDLLREAKSLRVKTTLWPRFVEVLGSSVVRDDLHEISLL